MLIVLIGNSLYFLVYCLVYDSYVLLPTFQDVAFLFLNEFLYALSEREVLVIFHEFNERSFPWVEGHFWLKLDSNKILYNINKLKFTQTIRHKE